MQCVQCKGHTDKDGMLSKGELKSLFSAMDNETFELLWKQADADGNGSVDLEWGWTYKGELEAFSWGGQVVGRHPVKAVVGVEGRHLEDPSRPGLLELRFHSGDHIQEVFE